MNKLILKQEYVDKIKTDPLLYGKVAYILNLTPGSLKLLLIKNDVRLTQASVLKILQDHLHLDDVDILTEEQREKAIA